MNAIPRPVVLLVWLTLGLVADASAFAADGATGTLEGRVVNARTGDYLARARVTVEGTALETLTDSSGSYRLGGVPVGTARVRAFFTGLGQQVESVAVTAGATARRDLSLGGAGGDVVKLGDFVVSSSKQMDGAAIAINEQRFASNMVNVVAADEFGSVLENNVGDFLKFMPGITIDFIGGAARIEVIHSPTPESPGSALAGSVNMVPRSAFDYARPRASYSVFLMMRDNERDPFAKTPGPRWVKTRKVHPGFDFSYIKPVNDRFGFTLTGADTKQYTQEERGALTWRGGGSATNGLTAATAATQHPDTTPDRPYLTDYVVEDGGKHTQRRSFGATVDYKFSAADRVSFALEYALFDSPLNQRNVTFSVQRVSPGNFSPTSARGDTGRGQMTQASQSRHHSRLKYMPMLTYRHNGPIWKWEGGAAISHEELTFRSIDKGYMNNVSSIRTNVTIHFDDIFYLRPGRVSVFDGTTGAPVDPHSLGTFQLNTGTGTSSRTQDVKRSAYGNLTRSFELAGAPLTLKGGLDVRQSIRDTRAITPSYTFARENSAILLDEIFSQRTPPFGFPKFQYVSTQEAYNYYRDNPSKVTVDQNALYRSQITGSKLATETISSAYLRGDLALLERRLKLVGGLRAEQANIDGQGPLTDPTRAYQRNAAGQILRAANGAPLLIVPTNAGLAYSQLTFVDRGFRSQKEYLRFFPSLNASYNVRENLIARAAVYRSVGRPNFAQYVNGVTLPDPETAPSTATITVNNAGIKAWSANTGKVRLEYYFAGVGQVSIGGFRRDFENFFGSTTFGATPEFLALYDIDPDTYGRFNVATQYNLPGKVRMTGAEFDYKQALTFLPHWARGVQVFANATAIRATGDDNANFSGYVPRSYNWGVSLARPSFNLRANWNYRGLARGNPVTGRSLQPGTFNWTSKLLFVDVQGEYVLRRGLAVFAVLRNVTDTPNDTKIHGPATPLVARFRQRNYYDSLWSFGVRGSF